MVIHGGWDVGNVYYDCTYILNTVDWSWEKVKINGPYKPVGRVGHTCVLYNDHHIFVFGGYGGEGYWDDLNQLDLHTGTWQRLEVMGEVKPCQRTFSTMEIMGNRILLFGGSNHDVEMNDVMVFNTDTRTWKAIDCVGQIPDGRFAHVSCIYRHKVYLYGGIVRSAGELSGMYELTLEHFTFDNTLLNILKSWTVQSGIKYQNYADCIPSSVVGLLDGYQAQMLQMQEWEKSQLTQKAQPDMPDAVDITGDEMVDAEEMDELEEDDNEDDLYAIVDDDFAAYESSENWDMAVDEPVQNLHQYVEEDKCELPAFDPYAAPISSPGATSSMMSPSSSSNADHHNHPMASPTSSTAYTALSTSPPNWPTAATSSAASSSGSMSSPPSVPELEPGAPDNNLQSNSSCQMSISSSPEPVQTCSMASPTYAQNDDTQWDIFYFSESDEEDGKDDEIWEDNDTVYMQDSKHPSAFAGCNSAPAHPQPTFNAGSPVPSMAPLSLHDYLQTCAHANLHVSTSCTRGLYPDASVISTNSPTSSTNPSGP
jgi:hypothetical protein